MATKKSSSAATTKTTETTAKKTAARKSTKASATAAGRAASKKTTTVKKKTTKAATKTAAKTATKATTKKTAKKAAIKTAKTTEAANAGPKPVLNVGQAPRKTTLAASIPVPTRPLTPEPAETTAPKEATAEQSASNASFKVKDKIVYPAHGVGTIVALEKQEVAGHQIQLFVIDFDQEKMKLRVPVSKATSQGMRPLSDDKTISNAIELLKGRARIKRTMWSRRAQEYDAKINSGDIKLVAEVVRDLYRADDQPEQSYSERQLFEAALDRMAREVAAVRKGDMDRAIAELDEALKQKAA